jgi:alpha-glucosidase
MTNEAERVVQVALDFLGSHRFMARIYADGDTPDALAITERAVDRRDSIELRLAPSGGGAIDIRPYAGVRSI